MLSQYKTFLLTPPSVSGAILPNSELLRSVPFVLKLPGVTTDSEKPRFIKAPIKGL